MRRLGAIVVAAALALSARAGIAYQGGEVKSGGSIAGEVELDGSPPPPRKVEITKDQEACGNEAPLETLVVSADRKIANAVVSVRGIRAGKKHDRTPPVLDQKGCRYRPHVVLVPAGVDVRIQNNDGILHNVHTDSRKNPPINVAQPKFKKEIVRQFAEPETIGVKCDTHEWMSGVLVVEEHPYYATSDANGAFSLTDVPAGEYTLAVWHERLGEQTRKVKVEAGKKARVTFKLPPR